MIYQLFYLILSNFEDTKYEPTFSNVANYHMP